LSGSTRFRAAGDGEDHPLRVLEDAARLQRRARGVVDLGARLAVSEEQHAGDPGANVDLPFLRGISTHAERTTRTTRSISASW
jgi:hypothetical protein